MSPLTHYAPLAWIFPGTTLLNPRHTIGVLFVSGISGIAYQGMQSPSNRTGEGRDRQASRCGEHHRRTVCERCPVRETRSLLLTNRMLKLQEVKVGLAEAALGEGTGTKLHKLSVKDIKFVCVSLLLPKLWSEWMRQCYSCSV